MQFCLSFLKYLSKNQQKDKKYYRIKFLKNLLQIMREILDILYTSLPIWFCN